MNPRTLDRIIPAVLVSLLFIAIAYTAYINIVNPPHTYNGNNTQGENERIILVVNKSINEWKRIYREYVIYSDKAYREEGVVAGEYNLSQLLSIIDHANSSVIIRKFYFYDDVIHRYVVLEIVIPLFIVELHLRNMPQHGSDPVIVEIANTLKKYVEEYPSNYTEYRLALIVLKIASQIHYKWEPKSYDTLLEIVYNEGNCGTKSSLAVELAANVGLWSAYILARACSSNNLPTDHQYVAIAIDNPPPHLKGGFNFTWRNHTFYVAELAAGYVPDFPIKPYPCSLVESIVAPYFEKTYYVGKPLW